LFSVPKNNTHLLFLLTRRAHINNPTRETTIPNPGVDGVTVAVTVTFGAAGSVGVSVAIGVDAGGIWGGVSVKVATASVVDVAVGVRVEDAVGGGPIAVRAAAGSVAWLAWFSNSVP
jgi:hypothetical protein